MGEGWWVSRQGQVLGPFGEGKLLEYAEAGLLGPEDQVMAPGSSQWVPAPDVDVLKDSISAQRPSAPSARVAHTEQSVPQPASGGTPVAPRWPLTVVLPLVIAAVVFVGVPLIVAGRVSISNPSDMARWWTDQFPNGIRLLIRGEGERLPAADLQGTWTSAEAGKGFSIMGDFVTPSGTTKVFQQGDVELVVDSISGTTATGRMRFTNVYGSTMSVVAGRSVVTPRVLIYADSGWGDVSISVRKGILSFSSPDAGGSTAVIQGSYVADVISGTMTIETPNGPIQGLLRLVRQK